MSVCIEFNDVSCSGFFNGLNLSVEMGNSVMVVTSREDESEQILHLAAGLTLPSSGNVLLNGESTRDMSYHKLAEVRQRLGLLPMNGGLISNLKLWENITLPELYHDGSISESAEKFALDLLERSGYSGNIMALPALLSLYERRVASFIRAALRKPDTLVCSHTLDGISAVSRARLGSMIAAYQQSVGMGLIYLTDTSAPPADIIINTIVTVH